MEQPNVVKSLEDMTLVELRNELVNKFSFVGADSFTTKAQLIAVYNNLSQRKDIQKPEAHDNDRLDEKFYNNKAAKMKALCDAEPKVRFMIPLNGEKKGSIETCQINGYRLNILKGVMVNIPMRFAKLLEESYSLTESAGQDLLADRDDTVKEKLGM